MGKFSNMPKKFDQEAKDRVVRLVEDRILAESISTQAACKIMAHSGAMDASPLDVRDALPNGCLRTLWQRPPSCVEIICQTLNTHREGGFLTSRGYRQSKARGLSARSLRDAALVEHSHDVHFQKLRRLRRTEDAARAAPPGH